MTCASLSSEAQLLLLTAGVRPSDTAMRSLLTAGIDWAKLCALAEHEKATSIVLRQLWRLGLAFPDCVTRKQVEKLADSPYLPLREAAARLTASLGDAGRCRAP